MELLDDLRGRLFAHADPQRAEGAAAYMRNQFRFYGIPSPVLRTIAREVTAGRAAPSERVLRDVALACWDEPEREWQYFALGYLRRHIRVVSAGFIDVAHRLVVTKSWWDTIDALASHTVGPLVRAHGLGPTMDAWIADENFWVARTAILHQLSAKAATDTQRLFAYCTARAADTEFFIRKAIGWALREYSKTDEAAVRGFVGAHPELSHLSRTEALKWLERRARR